MSVPPKLRDEHERLRSLLALDVLDSPPEAEFDALVHAAALVCGTPISLISLIDRDRQWFKANIGLPGVSETPRELAFCAHAIEQDELFEVPNATRDRRFAENPLVTSDPNIRFYAGVPLRLRDGANVGTLCVIDRVPRELDATQREILRNLAEAAVKALEQRRAALGHAQATAQFVALGDTVPLGIYVFDAEGRCSYSNKHFQEILGLSREQSLGDGWRQSLHPDDRAAVLREGERCRALPFDMAYRLEMADGTTRHVHARSKPILGPDGVARGHIGCIEDVTESVELSRAKQEEHRRLVSVIEATGAGTWEWNVQTGEVHCNEQWAAIVGCTVDELRPLSMERWLERAHPDDAPRSRRAMHRHLAGETPTYEGEARLRHRDGHWVWALDRGRVLTWTADGKPEWMFGTQLDITRRKQQEVALASSEKLLQRMGEVAGVGGWEIDVESNEIRWSEQTCRIHGLPPGYRPNLEEAIEYYAPEARPVIQAAVARAMEQGGGWDLELPFIQADGTPIWVRSVGQAEFEGGRPLRLIGAFQDVTDRVQQRQALEGAVSRHFELSQELAGQHELLRVTLQSIGDAVITTDAAGHINWLNPVAEHMTGWGASEAAGLPLTQVFRVVNEDTRHPSENPVVVCLQKGKVVGLAGRTVLISRDGREFGIEDSAAPIRDEYGEVLGVVLVFHDVTEQRRLSGEMNYRATHDALTGLVNRTEFETRLRRSMHSAHQDHSEHSLMFIDLDQFKLVNDACGHSVGDQLLQQVAKLLTDIVRSRDTLARLGGDEFAVILEHCTTEQALRVAEQICKRMDQWRFVHDARRFRIGTSIGLVPVDARWSSTAAVMQAADTSCYAAKEAGRNRVHTWSDTDSAMRSRHGEMNWATRLEQALDEEKFALYAQRLLPLGDEAEGLHAEVLLRFVDDDGSIIPPGAFLPAAERFHLSSRIDRWVLRQVIDQLSRLSELGQLGQIAALSVNLSGQSIGDRAFHRDAMEYLVTAGGDVCQRLCLEITETAAITKLADAATFIEQVRSLGVRIALDDFGAGASSFGYLNTLTVDSLKIDGQYIQDLLEDPLHDVAVRCFVDVARVVGLRTVAEFVDRPDVLQRVRELGIHYAQGFLLHKPEPLELVLCAARASVEGRASDGYGATAPLTRDVATR